MVKILGCSILQMSMHLSVLLKTSTPAFLMVFKKKLFTALNNKTLIQNTLTAFPEKSAFFYRKMNENVRLHILSE